MFPHSSLENVWLILGDYQFESSYYSQTILNSLLMNNDRQSYRLPSCYVKTKNSSIYSIRI